MLHLSPMNKYCVTILMLGSSLALGPSESNAHGGLGHIQVTAWAVENLPQGDLRSFLAHPAIFNSILFGSAFPDIGFYPGLQEAELTADFGEYSHWPPFIAKFIEWVRVNDPPPWTSLESQMRVAFLLGCAAHGFQDEIFDALFLPQVDHHDHVGQNAADTGTDGLLVNDALMATIPYGAVPIDALLEIYNSTGLFQKTVTEEILINGVETMTGLYIEEVAGPFLAQIAFKQQRDVLTWTKEHYMDADIPGSLMAEILPTSRYVEAVWKRLHGDLSSEDAIMWSFPEQDRRLRSYQSGLPDSWVSILFATGVNSANLTASWQTDDNTALISTTTRYGAWGTSWPRIVRLIPNEDLEPGAHYTVKLQGDIASIDEQNWTLDYSHRFQVACTEASAEACPNLASVPLPRLDGADEFISEWPDDTNDNQSIVKSSTHTGCTTLPHQGLGLLVFVAWLLLCHRRS